MTTVAVRTFPCPRCGADVVWHPDSGKLRCDYCGAENAVATAGDGAPAPVVEQPLQEALRAPGAVGWGTERRSFRCASCGAVGTLEPGVAAGACAFCATPQVVETAPDAALVRPQGVLPFRIGRADATGRFRAWLRALWFRPSDLARHAELDAVRGVYVPFWSFDADSRSRWRAEAGRRVGVGKHARIDWRDVSGTLEHRFDDLPVPASRGLDDEMARGLEPFPTRDLVAYDPQFLSGFLAEEYGVALPEAYAAARRRMDETLRAACRAEVPGDLCRGLEVETEYSGLACKSGLLPVWIAAYRYRGRVFRWVVNGATGRAHGTAPWSAVKIALAVLAALAVLLLLSNLG